jgi:hypothetical protein
MLKLFSAVFLYMYMAAPSSFAQTTTGSSTAAAQASEPQYQVGTIMAVKAHEAGDGSSASVPRYDVSVRVVSTDFVVLYTPAHGGNAIEYKAGMAIPVLVGSDTLIVRDLLGNKLEAPIISRKTLPAQRVP